MKLHMLANNVNMRTCDETCPPCMLLLHYELIFVEFLKGR